MKKGFSRDISKSTISHWIKDTIRLCYQSANADILQLSRVKAHDVRALSASLAFRGGVPLDQILSACYWRSHGTFTSFYLKDVCWHNHNIFKLGSLVASQHVVSSKSFILPVSNNLYLAVYSSRTMYLLFASIYSLY